MSEARTPPKRLLDLNPHWSTTQQYPNRKGLYLVFDCPCGKPAPTHDAAGQCEQKEGEFCPNWGRHVIPIENPIDGGPPASALYSSNYAEWTRAGDAFETLTLAPSIRAIGHWHGWIRDGMVTSC